MTSASSGPLVVGIDLGGTKILAGVVDADNQVRGRAKRATPAKEGAEAILREMVGTVEDAVADAGVRLTDVAAAGVGSPGPLDTERGVILFSANLAVRDFALGPDLARALGRPVLVLNDVRVGGYGEFRLGAGKGHSDLIAAFVGTGIGGCVVVDGKVVHGMTGNAGEIGHVCVKAKGPRCGCGRRGCLEALASRSAMARRIGKALASGRSSLIGEAARYKAEKLKSKELANAYKAGDPLVVKEVHRAAHYLGLGLGGLVNVLGPQLIVVGGGVAVALGERYLDVVRESLREQTLTDPEGKTQLTLAALGDDAGILGGALLARERFVDPNQG